MGGRGLFENLFGNIYIYKTLYLLQKMLLKCELLDSQNIVESAYLYRVYISNKLERRRQILSLLLSTKR